MAEQTAVRRNSDERYATHDCLRSLTIGGNSDVQEMGHLSTETIRAPAGQLLRGLIFRAYNVLQRPGGAETVAMLEG
ncbi:hypothetical protein, partial [Salmonella enterica]|uniref:hypothetical protein n=1 Tax=Salmonella enterica TaxID=28901 RepID=UPI0032999691